MKKSFVLFLVGCMFFLVSCDSKRRGTGTTVPKEKETPVISDEHNNQDEDHETRSKLRIRYVITPAESSKPAESVLRQVFLSQPDMVLACCNAQSGKIKRLHIGDQLCLSGYIYDEDNPWGNSDDYTVSGVSPESKDIESSCTIGHATSVEVLDIDSEIDVIVRVVSDYKEYHGTRLLFCAKGFVFAGSKDFFVGLSKSMRIDAKKLMKKRAKLEKIRKFIE